MTDLVPLLDGPLRWVAFAALATASGLVVARLAAARGASVRHGACFLGLLAALALPLASVVLPRLDVVVETAAAIPGGAPTRSVVPTIAGVLWALIATLLLARLASRALAVRQLAAGATPVTSPTILAEARAAARAAGLVVTPRVVTHAEVASPAAWGVRRAVVFLPEGADLWSRGRLRAVLLHECAHLARRDPLTQLVADAACAAFWFVPFAWTCAAWMRREREIACDDLVVRGGARPSGYARFLLRWSCDRSATPRAAAALGGVSELEARIRALLAPAAARGLASRDERALACAAVLVAVALGASVRPVLRVELPTTETRPVVTAAAEVAAADASDPTECSADASPRRASVVLPTLDAPLTTPDHVPTLATLAEATPDAGLEAALPTRRADVTLGDLLGVDGHLLGGAVHADPQRGLVIDAAALKAFLGLPEDTHVSTVVAPLVFRRAVVRRR